LTDLVFNAVRAKTAQCSGLGAPCLLMVGTFHWEASRACVQEGHIEELLRGKGWFAWDFDPVGGQAVGGPYPITKLESSTFIRPGKQSLIEHARCPVSAVMVCGLGAEPPRMLGALHPQAAHEFDPAWLRAIPFCKLNPGYIAGKLSVSWVNR
jgi:hypothetical protein